MTEFALQPPAPNERTLLLELNHRIDNEFASALNLIVLAAVRSDNPEVKTALADVVELLDEHAGVVRSLQTPEDDGLIDAADYLGRLCLSMSRSRLDRMNIHLVFAADALLLQSERCRRLGMIVYELVSNSARHAFFAGHDGEIRVELSREGALMRCQVSDNGSASAASRPGRGLRILDDLCKSLGGRVHHSFGAQGCYFALAMPLTESERHANRKTAPAARGPGFGLEQDLYQQQDLHQQQGLHQRQDLHQRARVA